MFTRMLSFIFTAWPHSSTLYGCANHVHPLEYNHKCRWISVHITGVFPTTSAWLRLQPGATAGRTDGRAGLRRTVGIPQITARIRFVFCQCNGCFVVFSRHAWLHAASVFVKLLLWIVGVVQSADWMRIRTGPDFQIQCIVYWKQQNPDFTVYIAIKL